jgi:hypothetical protein
MTFRFVEGGRRIRVLWGALQHGTIEWDGAHWWFYPNTEPEAYRRNLSAFQLQAIAKYMDALVEYSE